MVNSSSLMLKKINQIIIPPFVKMGILALVALVFTKYYFLLTNEYYPPAYAEKIASFEADKVFQKRFLIPVVGTFLSQNTHLSFDQSLKFLTVVCTFGLLYSFKKLLDFYSNGFHAHYWCLLLLIPVGWNYMFINSIYHSYDIPTLFFFSLCLYLFLKKNYIQFYVFFVISTLNRESSCFITISLALLLFKFSSKFILKENCIQNSYLARHLFVQSIIWLFIVLLIRWIFVDSPGHSYETTYSMKAFLTNMWNGSNSWPFLNTETFFGNPRSFLTLFACSWVLIPFLWKYIPKDCKKLLLLIPIYMIPAFLYANLMESRVYHELNVVIALAVTTGLMKIKYRKLNSNMKTNA